MRVLVVEDEPTIRFLVSEALQESGYEVIEAVSGDDAVVQLARPESVQLLLADLNLGSPTDGVDVALTARRRHPDLPVLFMSGRPDLVQSSARTPMPYGLLSKPFRMADWWVQSAG